MKNWILTAGKSHLNNGCTFPLIKVSPMLSRILLHSTFALALISFPKGGGGEVGQPPPFQRMDSPFGFYKQHINLLAEKSVTFSRQPFSWHKCLGSCPGRIFNWAGREDCNN